MDTERSITDDTQKALPRLRKDAGSNEKLAHTSNDGSTCDDIAIVYVHGVRHWAIGLVLVSIPSVCECTLTLQRISVMYFLAGMDMTIASTSLVAITNDLGNFERASWILTSYSLGYIGKEPMLYLFLVP